MEGIRTSLPKLPPPTLHTLRNFMEEVTLKMPTDTFYANPLELSALLDHAPREKEKPKETEKEKELREKKLEEEQLE